MGCHEVCGLTGSYIPKKLSKIADKESIGIYRDDRLAIVQKISDPQIERKRKGLTKMFKTAGLNITILAGLRIVSLLDVQFNLNSGRPQLYRKCKINKKSNQKLVVLNNYRNR